MLFAGAVLLAMQAVPATFYNRPGADDALLAAELARCRRIATGLMVEGRALTPPVGSPSNGAGLSSDAGCMVARGWRLYRLSPAEQAILAKLSAGQRSGRMRALAGARRPAMGRRVDAPRRSGRLQY